MPESYFHVRCARASYRGSGARGYHIPAIMLGAAGPDVFYYHMGLPALLPLGQRMHAERCGPFLTALARRAESRLCRSYVLGFLSHNAVDATMHPWVERQAEAHAVVESALDSHYLRLDKGRGLAMAKDCAPRLERPELLELEVTESVLVNREQHAVEKLNALYENGVCVALDDFGTGFSSLSLLNDLKISTLKVDKTFIQNTQVAELAKMIVRLGHLFGAKVVAEGVETEEQMRFARHAGCDRVQGYYQALPMPIESLMRYLETKAYR